tara:strand:+ start:1060 stop:1272 length:213 start_codon:yes stop_codon:yes gene_type:complete
MISIESFALLMSALLIIGGLLLWRHGTKCYDKGITDAILMHREGRLHYNTYLDDNGDKMVNIEIDPLEDE